MDWKVFWARCWVCMQMAGERESMLKSSVPSKKGLVRSLPGNEGGEQLVLCRVNCEVLKGQLDDLFLVAQRLEALDGCTWGRWRRMSDGGIGLDGAALEEKLSNLIVVLERSVERKASERRMSPRAEKQAFAANLMA